jgi:hypothetical protein
MATANSWHQRTAIRILAVVLNFLPGLVLADAAQNKIFIARAEAEYDRTQKLYVSATNSVYAIDFARACFDLADLTTNKTERATTAHEGINACCGYIEAHPDSTPAHYYLGMNLGELADTEYVGALRIVREMEREFKTATKLEPHYDYAGPERCLGLLYREAPGWPVSLGNKRKAKNYLQIAATLSPDYPENILNLAESELNWHDFTAAQKESDALDQLWPQAQKQFIGDQWEQEWADWTARREALHQKLADRKTPN